MDNLVKRIVQKEFENHGEPPKKEEKTSRFSIGKTSGKNTWKRGTNQ